MGEQMVGFFAEFLRESIALTVNSCLIVCTEIFKFFLILLVVYYFTLWSFRVLDQLSLTTPVQAKLASKNYLTTEYDSEAQSVVSDTFLRIGAPDEKLIKQRASLLEQLEIEAEFEENIKQNIKSENNTESRTRNSSEAAPIKDLFISQKIYEPNETSQPSQTTKTSLGEKSKPREDQSLENSTLIQQPENKELWSQINDERECATNVTTSAEYETSSSYDGQKNL